MNTEKSPPSIGTRIFLVLVVIVGLALIALGCYLTHRQLRLQFYGKSIRAEVTGLRTHESSSGDSRNRTTYHASYRFTTPDGKTFEGQAQVEKEFYDDKPKETEILYDPSNPSISEMPASAARWVFPGFAFAAGFIILVLRFQDKTAGPWVPLEKKIPGGIKLTQNDPKPKEWLIPYRRPGGFLLGVGLAAGWNSLAGVLAYVCLTSQSYFGLILMSPLILIGVLMLVGFPITLALKWLPVFEICLDREPKPGERATLFWRCMGFHWLFGKLVIDLNQGAKRNQTALTILDCGRGKVKEGRVEFQIPNQCGPKAWHLFVEAKRLLGPNTRQTHPIPGTKQIIWK